MVTNVTSSVEVRGQLQHRYGHCARTWKVAGSIPDELFEIFCLLHLLAALWPWGRLSL